MKFDKLYTLLLEYVFDYTTSNIQNEKDINKLIIHFYELYYKRMLIENSKLTDQIEPRKYRIVEKLEDRLLDVIKELKKRFIPVFQIWLEQHILNDPKLWTEARLKYLEPEYFTDVPLFEEYFHYKYPEQYKKDATFNVGKISNEVLSEILKNKSKFPKTVKLLNNFISRDKMQKELDEQYDENSTDIDVSFGFFTDYNEAIRFIKYADIDILEDTIINFAKQIEEVCTEEELYVIAYELTEIMLFPMWHKYWLEQGIEQTIKTVRSIYETMLKPESNDVNKEMANMSIILNTYHQNGKLLSEYFGAYDNQIPIDNELLDQLSKETYKEYPKWKKDIEDSGF
jgi:hypothetical protein